MTPQEAQDSLAVLFSGPPEVGNDRVRIWASEVAAAQVLEYVEDHAVLSITMKSGATLTVESSLRGTK